MFKKFLAAASVMSLVAVASAGTITVDLVPVTIVQPAMDLAVDIPTWMAAGYKVYDLQVTVDNAGGPADEWTAASGYAHLTNGAFWEHPVGTDLPPSPALFAAYGLLAYDSFWTSPEDWPNPDTGGMDMSFAPGSPIQKTATDRDAEWYVNPEDPSAGAGTWTIARYCFLPSGAWELCVSGNTYLALTGGDPYPYSVCVEIPEPGSLGLLALGALGLIRRR
jgi:hypothetical protein